MKHTLAFVILALGIRASGFGQAPSPSPTPALANPKPLVAISPLPSPCAPVVDVCAVLDQYASLTHLKVIRDAFVQGRVCLSDLSGLPSEKAIEMIERTLFANWYAIIQIDPDTVEVTGKGLSGHSAGIPVISDLKELPTRERLVSFVFGFKYRTADEMRQVFFQHLSPIQPWTSVIVEPKGNTLLVTERSSVVRRLIEIAAKMDVPDWKKEP
jgi:type II secretory pathway component GspD/PulD (secretin)